MKKNCCKTLFFTCFLLFTAILGVVAQPPTDDRKKINIKKLLAVGEEAIRIEEYHNALAPLKQIQEVEPRHPQANYLLGITYLNTDQEASSLPFFETAQQGQTPTTPPMDNLAYYLGRAYHLNLKIDSAEKYYALYKKNYKEGSAKPVYERSVRNITPKDIDFYLSQCVSARKLMGEPVNVKITNLGPKINSKYPDFVPVVSADETKMIFTSRRPGGVGNEIDVSTGQHFEDIYVSEKDESGEWTTPINIGSHINSDGHDASIGLSPDGQVLYIYKDDPKASQLAGDIYESKLESGQWTKPVKMQEGINSEAWEPSASISADEKVFFFSSDRTTDGAIGGRDIYMVRRLPDLTWAAPINLGPKINTPYDEDAPFIHPLGKRLYFSSRGHNSMGGFDIFVAEWNDSTLEWSEPKNLGYPINGASDDIYFVFSADGVRGYFSSSRVDSYGEKDIYMVEMPEEHVVVIVMKGKVYDENTKAPVAALIEITDNSTQKVITAVNANDFNGRYTVVLQPNKSYGIQVTAPGYLMKSFQVNMLNQFEALEIVQNVALQPDGKEGLEPLNNIAFTQEVDVKFESEAELMALKKMMDANPLLNVEILVHTDNAEDSLVSMYKSQARAEAIVETLINWGIDPKRLKAKGYGSLYPVADNSTSAGRQRNSRVEYITRHQLQEYALNDYQRFRPDMKEVKPIRQLENIQVGYVFDLQYAINFKTGTNTLEESAGPAIDEIIEYMERYPNMVIEVGGHTDNVGSSEFNHKLSERRAGVVAQVLAFKGVDRTRLVVKGYGEDKPVADNSTDEGRKRNRRTEFKVIKWE